MIFRHQKAQSGRIHPCRALITLKSRKAEVMGVSLVQRKAIAFMVLGFYDLAISGVAIHALPCSSGWDLALLG